MGRKGFSGLMNNGGYDDIENNPNRMQREQSSGDNWGWDDNNSTNS